MNAPESDNPFVPKQALAPTPQLYDELVGDGMENLAKATVAQIPPITDGAVVHDNGCGTGAGTAAVVAAIADASATVSIKGTDINDNALKVYQKNADENNWPAEAINVDSTALSLPDDTFTHSIGNALLFVLPDDGVTAIKEAYRTLKPGGTMAVNSWAYVPNMDVIQAAAKATRPAGTPLPRQGLEKWTSVTFLQDVVEQGGFAKENINTVKADVYVTTCELHRYATMLWSFIGGTSAAGWLKSDEEKWDMAVDVVKKELLKTPGCKELDGGGLQLKFVANISLATK